MAGSYLIIFLKLNYNTEHRKLIKSNTLLQEKSVEVSFQNEELKNVERSVGSVGESIGTANQRT
jgi:hypothetical protein